MELNSNFTGIQNILLRLVAKTGQFTLIKYKGGNEQKIELISTELMKFFDEKHLFENGKSVNSRQKDLNDILVFLALNTEFKKPLEGFEDSTHLKGIIPQLSKCLLINLCFAFDLIPSFCYVMNKISLSGADELLDQSMDCLKNGNPGKFFRNASKILKVVIDRLAAVEATNEVEETMQDMLAITDIILGDFTSVSTDQLQSVNRTKIYRRMGRAFFYLLDLLLYIDQRSPNLQDLVATLITTTSNILNCVTLDVFCSWVDIDYEDQSLQMVVAEKAYLVVEKFEKNRLATELVVMLKSMARKPQTIAERIYAADVDMILKMVDVEDEHQQLWFNAIFTKSINDEKILHCIDKWWKLIDKAGFHTLLHSALITNNQQRELVLKCAQNLSVRDLNNSVRSYLVEKKFQWTEDITEELVTTFNKFHHNLNDYEQKCILILILRNSTLFLTYFFSVAFKEDVTEIFQLIADILHVDDIGLQAAKQIFQANPPTSENINNYIQLISALSGIYNWSFLFPNFIMPLLNQHENSLEEFAICLNILKHFSNKSLDLRHETEMLEYWIKIAAANRCASFIEFNGTKQEITNCCVECLRLKCASLKHVQGKKMSWPNFGDSVNDKWSDYYKTLFWSTDDVHFVDYVLPNFDLSDYKGEVDENFTNLLKILPRCISVEWKILLEEFVLRYGREVVLTITTDLMIFLCNFTEQSASGDNRLAGMQFCLQNYANFISQKSSYQHEQTSAVHCVTRVLTHLPNFLVPVSGMCLINAIPEEGLKQLAKNRAFIAGISQIKDESLRKAFAQKMMANIQ